MTLLELATFICGKLNQSEAEDVTACKGFLLRRAKMLWGSQLWKDSLVEFTQVLTPTGYTNTSTWLPTKGVLLLPPDIERVLAVRSDSQHLNVQRPEFFYRVDFNNFAAKGKQMDFVLLPPCVWEWEGDIQLSATYDSGTYPEDGAAAFTIDYLSADLVSVTRKQTTLGGFGGGFLAYVTTQRLDAWSKVATDGDVGLGPTGEAVSVSLEADETVARKRQRIRFTPVPDADSMTVRVLGKRVMPTFTDDNDDFGLTGGDNVLIAFAQADMLQRERHYGKAQEVQQEGALLLQDLIAQEVVQQAHNQRIMPEEGYGSTEFERFHGLSF